MESAKLIEKSLGFEVFLFCFSWVTIALNLLVLWVTIKRSKSEKAIDSQLISLIATFDIIMSLFLCMIQIVRWATGVSDVDFLESIWCKISSIFCASTIVIALSLTAQLAIIRYLAIVKSFPISNKKSNLASLILILIIMVVFIGTYYMGSPRLLESGLMCVTVVKGHGSAKHIIYSTLVFVVTIPVIFSIPIFYGLICLHYYKLNRRMKEQAELLGKSTSFFHSQQLVLLCVFTVIYFLSLLPEFLLLIHESNTTYKRPYVVDCITLFLIYTETFINPLFVLMLHPDSRVKLISLIKGNKREPIPVHTKPDTYQYYDSRDGFFNSNHSLN